MQALEASLEATAAVAWVVTAFMAIFSLLALRQAECKEA